MDRMRMEPSSLVLKPATPAELITDEEEIKLRKAIGLDEDLDKIEQLNMEEIPFGRNVYNACSVERIAGGGYNPFETGNGVFQKTKVYFSRLKEAGGVWSFRKAVTKTRARDSSSTGRWAKFVRDRLLVCYRSSHNRTEVGEVADEYFESVDFQDDAEGPSQINRFSWGPPRVCRTPKTPMMTMIEMTPLGAHNESVLSDESCFDSPMGSDIPLIRVKLRLKTD